MWEWERFWKIYRFYIRTVFCVSQSGLNLETRCSGSWSRFRSRSLRSRSWTFKVLRNLETSQDLTEMNRGKKWILNLWKSEWFIKTYCSRVRLAINQQLCGLYPGTGRMDERYVMVMWLQWCGAVAAVLVNLWFTVCEYFATVCDLYVHPCVCEHTRMCVCVRP